MLNIESVISTKHAATFLNVSYASLMKEIDTKFNAGSIRWQAKISDNDDSRPILGFDVDYLREVLSVLGKDRQKGKPIFTADVKTRLDRINKRWKDRG